MPHELILPATIMTLAFVFYTSGVWAERIQRDLLPWHVVAFWLGLACDGFATRMMELMRIAGEKPGLVHSVTGFSAFGLMAVHAVWATWVLMRGDDEARAGFHRYSIVVWSIWLIPYLGGMIAGIMRGANG
jgi:uncharacterized repeat protein (TIGR03987 family)